MNCRDEFIEEVRDKPILCAYVKYQSFQGQPFEFYLKENWYKDEREEYDGSEWWRLKFVWINIRKRWRK